MTSAADDIKDYLESVSSLGLNFGVNLFVGKEPVSPRDCVTIYDTPGYPPALTLDGADSTSTYEYLSMQVRVRNKSYTEGCSLAYDIMGALHGQYNLLVNGSLYTVIYCTGSPALLEWDDNNNAVFILNVNLQRRR